MTGVTETNVETFAGNWEGTGVIENSGDAERIALDPGEYMESQLVQIGGEVELLQNHYAAGDNVILKYRHGVDATACLAASWQTYSAPFSSLGYVQARVEVVL